MSDSRTLANARRSVTWSSACPKEIVADLRMPPQSRHGGSGSPAATRSRATRIVVRSSQVRQTTHEDRSMHLDDALRVAARELVKAVDVLGHDRVQPAS